MSGLPNSLSKAKYPLIFAIIMFIGQSLFAQDVPFDISTLQFNGAPKPNKGTALEFGPDGRLYLADLKGEIRIYTIEKTGQNIYSVTDYETLLGVQSIPNHDDIGILSRDARSTRQLTGITVEGTASNPVIYIGSSDPKWGGPSGDKAIDTNSGVITRLTWTGSNWDVVDLVRGLPRSEENHSTNGLVLSTINGKPYLLVASGGNTNAGSPSINFAWTTEYALSAAILSIDLNAINALPTKTDVISGRKFKYDIPTLDDPFRENVNGIYDPNDPNYDGIDVGDPFGGNDGLNMGMQVVGGPVQVFSGGYRNTYDVLVTEAGQVFVTDNGPNENWGGLPENEGNSGNVTNNYVSGELGNNPTNPAISGEYVTNRDHLMMVTNDVDNYQFGSYYGGHPSPIRANPGNPYTLGASFPFNPGGAGLFTKSLDDYYSWEYVYPSYSQNEVFRTQILAPVAPNETGFLDYVATTLPANWPPVPLSLANSAHGDYRAPDLNNPNGPQPEIVTMWPINTNAIAEYTSSAFGGAIKGAIIAGRNGGRLHLVTLNPDGSLDDLYENKWNLNGGNALGITANGDDEIFPGTIWVATFDDRISIFTPADLAFCPDSSDPLFDPDADYDNDGFTNQDEIDNGTDYCSGASIPTDFDGDLISDLNDMDDDDDGVMDEADPFQLGNPTNLPIDNELFSDNTDELGRPFGYLGLGLTGLMNNGEANPNWLNWLDVLGEGPLPNDIYGGAAGAIQIAVTGGTANGSSNNQDKGFQMGANVSLETGEFLIKAGLLGLDGPQMFYNIDHNGELGIQIGDGTQENFLKFVFTKTHIVAALEVDDVPDPNPLMLQIEEEDRPNSNEKVEFILRVSSVFGVVEPIIQIGNRPSISLGTKVLSEPLLNIVTDNSLPLAIGVFGTSAQQGVEFMATYDYFKVTADQPYPINNFLNLTKQVGAADKIYDLTDYFNDNNGVENLNFSLTNSNSAFGATISGSQLTLTFANQPDSTEIVLRATDQDGYFAEQSFMVKVIPAEQILYRVNAGGEAVSGEGASPNWNENIMDGAYEGEGYTVNVGTAKSTVFDYQNKHSSIPSYINSNTYSEIFGSARENSSSENMVYSIPVTNGEYNVNLYMGNGSNESSTVGARVFDVKIEDALALDDLDLVVQFGHGVGGMEQIPVTVTDGVLDIEFVKQTGNPIVHAIEISGTQVSDPIIIIQEIEDQLSSVGEVLDGTLRIMAEGGVGALYYTASNLPPGIDIEEVNGRIYGTVDESAVAGSPYQITIQIEDSNYPVQNVELFNFTWTIEQQNWKILNENQNYTARHENAFVQVGKFFYLLGGRENSKRIDKYDFEADSWSFLDSVAPHSFNHFQGISYMGYIWVIGAFVDNAYPNENPASNIWIFDPVNEEYIKGPEIPQGRRRGSAGLVMYNDKFYLIGGNTSGHNDGYVPYFDEYDPATGTWTILPNAPRPRDHFHGVVIGDKLYAAGGRLTGGVEGVFAPLVPEVDVFDFDTQTWSTLPSSLNIPTPRGAAFAANFNEQLVIAGGELSNSTDALTTTEIFNPTTQSWSNGLELNFPRHGTQMIVSGNGLFVTGGSPKRGGGNQKNMEYLGINNPKGQSLSGSTIATAENLKVNSEGQIVTTLDVSGGNQAIYIREMHVEGADASDFEFVTEPFIHSILIANSSNPIHLNYNGSKENIDAKLVVEYGEGAIVEFPIEGYIPGVIPNAPSIISPENQATNIDNISELSWQSEPLATEYRVQISINSNFATTITDAQGITETSFITPELQDLTTYYWRVAASNEEGESIWSEVRSFTTKETAIGVPAAPVHVSPANGSIDHSRILVLSWEEEAFASTYKVQISLDSDFSTTVVNDQNISGTNFTTPTLLSNTEYYWRVAATNTAEEDSPWSSEWSFTTAPDQLSSSELVGYWKMEEGGGNTLLDYSGKNNNATIQNNSGISWVTGVDGLALRMTGSLNRYASVAHNSTLDITEAITIAAWIKPNGINRKRILSKSGPDGYEFSISENGKLEFRFNRESSGTEYMLYSSSDYSSDGETWMHVAVTFDGTTSKIYVDGMEDNSTSYFPVTINSNTTELQIGAKYGNNRWDGDLDEVRLYNGALNDQEIFSLYNGETLVTEAPPTPVLALPENNTDNLSNLNLNLSWTASGSASEYNIQVSQNSQFTALLVDEVGVSAVSYTVDELQPNTTYYWRVAATNQNGSSPWSEIWSFKTAEVISGSAELVGYWKMEEGSGSTLTDHSGNGNNANLQSTSGISWVSGIDGLALRMNGSLNRYASVPHNPTLDITEAITIAAWIKPEGVYRKRILSKSGPDGYEFSIVENGKVEFRFNRESSGTNYRIYSNTDYPSDGETWMHVVATFDGTTSKIYINGVEDNSDSYPQSQINSNTTELQIGAKYGNNRWIGDLDEVRLYRGALNNQEVNDLFNGTSSVPNEPTAPLLVFPENFSTGVSNLNLNLNWEAPASADEFWIQVSEYPDFSGSLIEQTNLSNDSFNLPELKSNTTYFWRVIASNEEGYSPWSQVWSFTTEEVVKLVGYWKMEEGSGNMLIDHSGLGNNATLGNPSGITWVTGKEGLALSLTGLVDRYGAVPDNSSLNITEGITIAAWIKPSGLGNARILTKALPDGYELSILENGKIEFSINRESGGNNYTLLSNTDYPTDGQTWMHVAASFDGTNSRIYVNGLEDISVAYTPTQIISNSSQLQIGAKNGEERWEGELDEIRVYNEALTGSEIFDIFEGSPELPISPQLTMPISGISGLEPSGIILAWDPVDFADSYTVQFAEDLTFSIGETTISNIVETSYSMPQLDYNTTYYWRVSASNSAGDSPWSQVWDFTTTTEAIDEDLVGHWTMENGSGNTLIDYSGKGNDATIQNTSGISLVPGKVGQALRLPGSINRYASVPHNSTLDINEAITIAAWIKPTAIQRKQILSKSGPDGYELSIYETGKLEFRINRESSGSDYRINSNGNYIADGQTWSHVAVTFDGTTSKIYINGVEDNSATYFPLQINSNTTELQIGAKYGNNRWEGDLDEIRLYKRALSGSEIANLANPSQNLRVMPNFNAISENQIGLDEMSNQVDMGWTTRIYPNPVDEVINLVMPGELEGKVQIYLFDMKGVQMMNGEFEIKNEVLSINISKYYLSQGIHLLLINRDGRQSLFKFFKE
ncbi:LamG-like jellyroll fold domain-containing protein [Cyclobacterium marinum]|uniref:LamG-like jellyroll fold domain-containing protein n=1 Tax=Cyclobacterium marinum TaxID=104 RepID=UPI0030D7C1C6|tara:strand:- start:18941 stop:28405 length:9465 start_codon:yes stop_codon:yes gene_type:complete